MESNSFETIKAIGFSIIEDAHSHFEFDGLDNEEHIPALRSSINAILAASDKFIGKSAQKELAFALKTHALDLFVDLWLRLGAEVDDDQGPIIEKVKATKLFDEIYNQV